MNSSVSKDLRNLQIKIMGSATHKGFEVWFYPEYNGVKGFLGIQDIILLGLNPSSGTFPSQKDKKLYALLKEKRLENIHITDFIKVRAKNTQVSDLLRNTTLISEQVAFLKKEIAIIKPKIIILLGMRCEQLLKEYIPGVTCKVVRIKHYGYRYQPQEEVFKEISESLDKIIEIYRTME